MAVNLRRRPRVSGGGGGPGSLSGGGTSMPNPFFGTPGHYGGPQPGVKPMPEPFPLAGGGAGARPTVPFDFPYPSPPRFAPPGHGFNPAGEGPTVGPMPMPMPKGPPLSRPMEKPVGHGFNPAGEGSLSGGGDSGFLSNVRDEAEGLASRPGWPWGGYDKARPDRPFPQPPMTSRGADEVAQYPSVMRLAQMGIDPGVIQRVLSRYRR